MSRRPGASDAAQRELAELRREVDAESARLAARHADRLQCRRGCSACCIDGISVFEVEAEAIRRASPALLAEGQPHAEGACAFLDSEGACRVYEARPYVCRTQGLPLRWIDFGTDDDAQAVELRDICELNEGGAPLESLDADACWELGPVEARLATLQASLDGSELRRVALRSLFTSPPSDEAKR